RAQCSAGHTRMIAGRTWRAVADCADSSPSRAGMRGMPRYLGFPDQPSADLSTAVLLLNLGTPAAPTRDAVAEYLAEFLSDPRIVESPRWLWWPVLHGYILRTRPRRSAEA